MRFTDYLSSFRSYNVGKEAMHGFVGTLRAMRQNGGRDFEMLCRDGESAVKTCEDDHDAVVFATGFTSEPRSV